MFAGLLTLALITAQAAVADTGGESRLAMVAIQAQAPAAARTARPTPAVPRPSAPALPRATFITNMDIEFRKMDADKNGLVATREIEDFQRIAAVAEAQARSRKLFSELDRDRNGVLSQVEFAAMQGLNPRPDPEPMLRRFDANRDRAISLVEHRAGTLRNYDRLDTDMDGLVTSAEIQAGGTAR